MSVLEWLADPDRPRHLSGRQTIAAPTPPTAELHVHVEGTLEPDTIMTLATRNGIDLPYTDVDDLRRRYAFADLQGFLDLYYANMAVLRTRADFASMTGEYLDRAVAANVRHVELFFDPQAHLSRGVGLDVVVDGLAGALDGESRLSSGLIACFLRDRPVEEARDVLEELLARRAPIIGIGLDSAEVGHPPGAFAPVFDRAREAGLHLVAHAGEEGPASYVAEALDVLGVERIDHGIRALDDPELVARLRAGRVPLTVCPLSNVRLRAVATLAEHPLAAMLDAGLAVSVHSDDPAYFGGYVDDCYTQVARELALDPDVLARLALHSVDAAFLDPERAAALRTEVTQWAREWKSSR